MEDPMENPLFWSNFAAALLLIIFTGYTVLDGFDLGTGIILPAFFNGKEHSSKLISFISPFWDGNEVWMLTGAVMLFAAFPKVFAALLPSLYLPMIGLILCLIFRAVSFELSYSEGGGKRAWELVLSISSILISAAGLIILGGLIEGLPLNRNHEFSGSLLFFFRPFPLIFCLTGLGLLAIQGLGYVLVRAEGDLQLKALKTVKEVWMFTFILVILTFILVLLHPSLRPKKGIWIGATISILILLIYRITLKRVPDLFSFLISSLILASGWIFIAISLYPNLLPAGNDPALSLTIRDASAPAGTQKFVSLFSSIGLVIIIFYTGIVYRIFHFKNKNHT
jgi:cytochrome d ubiquinol oxidase subunit II